MFTFYLCVIVTMCISVVINRISYHFTYKLVTIKSPCYDFRNRALLISFIAEMAVWLIAAIYNAVFVQGGWNCSMLAACGFGGLYDNAYSFSPTAYHHMGRWGWYWNNAAVSTVAWLIIYPILSFLFTFRGKHDQYVKPWQRVVTVLITTVTNAPYHIIFGLAYMLAMMLLSVFESGIGTSPVI